MLLSRSKYFAIIFFVLTLVVLNSCSKEFNQRMSYISSSELTLIDKNGDTITGHFLKSHDQYYMLHENRDSNYQYENQGLLQTRFYYYKKFSVHEIRGYIDEGQKYEPVYITFIKREPTYAPEKKQSPVFMQRLTSDSSYPQLYLHLRPDTGRGIMSQLFFRPDTTIDHYDYFIELYLHFPDEHPKLVWSLNERVRENKRLRERMVEAFCNCPALSETVAAMNALPGSGYVGRVLATPDSTIKTRGMAAVMERIAKYNQCYKQSLE